MSVIGSTHMFDNLIKVTKNLLKDDIRVCTRVGSRHHVQRLQDGSVEEEKREEDADLCLGERWIAGRKKNKVGLEIVCFNDRIA
jgi:hypothetical protein